MTMLGGGVDDLRRIYPIDVNRYDALIFDAANYYALPAPFVKAIIAIESSFEPAAVSPKGAKGLMQLLDRTAERMGVRDSFDARDNVFGGARYLRFLANLFAGDLARTAAAYNAGEEAVRRYQGVPPFAETREYVRRVQRLYAHYLSEQLARSNDN
jgi:soluble lytic murein transglycosylase-like protein